MTDLVNSLMQERGSEDPNIYERALMILNHISAYGFTEKAFMKDGSGRKVLRISGGEEDELSIHLIEAISQMTQDIDSFDMKDGELALVFPHTVQKPPVRLMRHNLDKLKSYLFDECITKDPNGPGYLIDDPHKLPFDPVLFAWHFIRDETDFELSYRLPSGTRFTDMHGIEHSDKELVSDYVMHQYLEREAPQYLEDFEDGHVMPARIRITPETMQHLMDEMGYAGIERGRRPS